MRTDIITDFLQSCDRGSDLYYSIVSEQTFLEQAPTLHWTYMKVSDGSFASGNLILIDPAKVVDKYSMIKFLSTNRKSFALGVFRASPYLFLKLIFGRIRLVDAERLMTKMFQITSKLVVLNHFEVAYDLDLPEHLDWLNSL